MGFGLAARTRAACLRRVHVHDRLRHAECTEAARSEVKPPRVWRPRATRYSRHCRARIARTGYGCPIPLGRYEAYRQ